MTKTKPCPICKRPAAAQYRPFCSRGCRDKDLLRWFGEDYAVPGEPAVIPDADADGLD
jgi:endogenous inhibitor of DNA gyrase (YacG/DUF329 family)